MTSWPGTVRRLGVALVAAALVTVALSAPVRAAPAPRDLLRRAAKGAWTGPFGTVSFDAKGAATFAVRACGYTPLRPGFVEVFTDCDPDTVSGSVRVATGGYIVTEADGTHVNFAAYVVDDELHVGPGSVVTRLSRERQGTVDIGGGTTLHVGDGRCRYTQPFAPKTVERPCRFVQRSGRTVLLYRAPDPIKNGSIAVEGLDYLPQLRLLVSPELVERPFTREQP